MKCRLELNDFEWEIVLEVLERERGELHAEVRHTDSRQYRHKLQERLEALEGMVARLKAESAVQV